MTLTRAGTHAIRIDKESTFGVEPGSFDVNKLSIVAWDIAVTGKKEDIPNQGVRTDLYEHETAEGLAKDGGTGINFSSYVEGLGAGAEADNGTLAVATAFTRFMECCLGSDSSANTGSTVKAASSPTTTVVEETDAGNHAVREFAGFITPTTSRVQARFIQAYSTDEMTLPIPLDEAPAVGADIYGAITIAFQEDHDVSCFFEAIGKNKYQNYEIGGAVGTFSLPEVAASKPQTINWQIVAHSFVELPVVSQVAPTNTRAQTNAGGEFLILKSGNQTTLDATKDKLKWARWTLELGTTLDSDEDCNSYDIGYDGVTKTDLQMRLTLLLREGVAMPTGFSSATYREGYIAGGAENSFQIQLTFGQETAGKICVFYFPEMRMITKPEPVDVDGKAAQRITFAPIQGMTPHEALYVGQL
jgi:hypothetical protein